MTNGDSQFGFVRRDYETILRWCHLLSVAPDELIQILKSTSSPDSLLPGLRVAGGRIVSLVWDFDRLPITHTDFCDSLGIEELVCCGTCTLANGVLKISSNSLRSLVVEGIDLFSIDLSGVPYLSYLNCKNNHLSVLDLFYMSSLESLDCSKNKLTDLDLSPVASIRNLKCSENELNEIIVPSGVSLKYLDCSRNGHLETIMCDGTELNEIVLSGLPGLKELNCNDNRLVELDLSELPNLTTLDCSFNELTILDLSTLHNLEYLNCSNNNLECLDLLSNPCLEILYCSNCEITRLDLSASEHLKILDIEETPVRIAFIRTRTRPYDNVFEKLWQKDVRIVFDRKDVIEDD